MSQGAERLTYEIRVRGELTDALIAALKPLGLRVEQTSTGPVLIGAFRDQAELHGALQAMQDLGVELLEMRQTAGWT
jgi:hypothetical protein